MERNEIRDPRSRIALRSMRATITLGYVVMRYAIVKAAGNYSVYVPDLPGCVATAATVEAVEEEIREAIRFHIDGLKEDGLTIPEPTTWPSMPKSKCSPSS